MGNFITTTDIPQEVKDTALTYLEENTNDNCDLDSHDLFNRIYNEDYFIIGYAQAEEFLNKVGVFNAIGEIVEYEKFNFGEVSTNLQNSESVANMYAYIKGEEFLLESETYTHSNGNLSKDDLITIYNELT